MGRYLREKLPDDPIAALAELARILGGGDRKVRAVSRQPSRAHAKRLKARRIAQGMKRRGAAKIGRRPREG